MTKLKQKIQGGDAFEHHLLKCYCGEDSYLEISRNTEDGEYYIYITMHPTRLKQRLRLAWKALRGLEFTASNEVIVMPEDVPQIIRALKTTKS